MFWQTSPTKEEILQMFIIGCEKHIQQGGKIIQGFPNDEQNGKCPLNCLVGDNQSLYDVCLPFGRDPFWVDSFITSFDGEAHKTIFTSVTLERADENNEFKQLLNEAEWVANKVANQFLKV